MRMVRPLAPNRDSAAARSSSPAPGPAHMALMPIPTPMGVLGITRTTRAAGPIARAIVSARTPAITDTTTRGPQASSTRRQPAATVSNACGLTARTRPAPGRAFSHAPTLSSGVLITLPNGAPSGACGSTAASAAAPSADAAPDAMARPMLPAPMKSHPPFASLVVMGQA